MPLDPKNRMISFRLREEEFDRFRAICFNYGARSVSELARTAINKLLEEPSRAQKESLAARVAELEGQIRFLSLELRRLNQVSRVPKAAPMLSE